MHLILPSHLSTVPNGGRRRGANVRQLEVKGRCARLPEMEATGARLPEVEATGAQPEGHLHLGLYLQVLMYINMLVEKGKPCAGVSDIVPVR